MLTAAGRLAAKKLENPVLAVVANKTNSTTLLGAQIFFWARVAHGVAYLIGIQWLRTTLWVVSLIGLIMIGSQLL